MADRKIVHVFVSGTVQGVWFRAWTMQEAQARGLDGWVRNRRDGRVEAVFAGPTPRVDDMLAACRSGPPAAEVQDVSITSEAEDPGTGFRKLSTA